MKKNAILTVLLLIISIIANAQNDKVVSAYNYLNKGKLDKAKEAIDLATNHEKTMGDAKAWLYRGNVYVAISTSPLPAYKNLDTNALNIATDAYLKCLELDKKGSYKEDALTGIDACSNQLFDKAATYYNAKNYKAAIVYFEKSITLKNKANQFDVVGTYYAAKSYEFIANEDTTNKALNKFDNAQKYYAQLIEKNFNDTTLTPQIYISLAEIDLYKKDTSKAIKRVQDGRKIYTDNFNLMIEEANIYLKTNQKNEADKIIDKAILKDPNNPNLRYYVGTNYFNMLEKMSFEKDSVSFKSNFIEAEKNLKKAIELEPKLYDAIYNLGALYLNEGKRIIEAADKLDPLKDAKKYEVEKQKSQVLFLNSIAQFEKYYEAYPNDVDIMRSLRILYIKTDQMKSQKYIDIDEKLKKK